MCVWNGIKKIFKVQQCENGLSAEFEAVRVYKTSLKYKNVEGDFMLNGQKYIK